MFFIFLWLFFQPCDNIGKCFGGSVICNPLDGMITITQIFFYTWERIVKMYLSLFFFFKHSAYFYAQLHVASSPSYRDGNWDASPGCWGSTFDSENIRNGECYRSTFSHCQKTCFMSGTGEKKKKKRVSPHQSSSLSKLPFCQMWLANEWACQSCR